jgi:hypothetical protein
MNAKQETRASIFTMEQEMQLRQLKAMFPFRIVWGCIDENGNFESHASYDRRALMARVRKPGWLVATIG